MLDHYGNNYGTIHQNQKWAASPSIWTPTKNRKLRDVTNSIILSKLIETKASIAVQDFL